VAEDPDPTMVLPELTGSAGAHTDIDATEIGTQAASPKALLDAAAAGPHGQTELGPDARPSNWATASQRTSPTTAAEVLDKSDLVRSKVFHMFGVTAPLGALVLSLLIGGDPLARYIFWAGACVLALCNVGLIYLHTTPERYDAKTVGVLWVISTVAIQGSVRRTTT
jgi:hypothetical protein